MHAVLEYTYAANYLEAREEFRSAHLALAWAAVERGELLLGGAVGSERFTGLLIFQGQRALEAAEAFAAVDPYVTGGVVTAWSARPWTTVVGEAASTPVRPE
jgi:uncharacterized protein YciI